MHNEMMKKDKMMDKKEIMKKKKDNDKDGMK